MEGRLVRGREGGGAGISCNIVVQFGRKGRSLVCDGGVMECEGVQWEGGGVEGGRWWRGQRLVLRLDRLGWNLHRECNDQCLTGPLIMNKGHI